MLLSAIALTVVLLIIYKRIAKSICKRDGHRWIKVGGHLKCARCGKKSNGVTVVRPEGRELK